MSVFDYVNFKIDCPHCNKEVTGFQTKDLNRYFEDVEFWECDNFYSSCGWCNTWIEFELKNPRPEIPIGDYEMKFSLTEKDESQIMRNAEGKIYGFKNG